MVDKLTIDFNNNDLAEYNKENGVWTVMVGGLYVINGILDVPKGFELPYADSSRLDVKSIKDLQKENTKLKAEVERLSDALRVTEEENEILRKFVGEDIETFVSNVPWVNKQGE